MNSPKKVVDLANFPDTGLMSEEEANYYEDCAFRVEEVTPHPPGVRVLSLMPCEKRDQNGHFCEGPIEVIRHHIPKQVHWKCQKCGDEGIIINFEGTEWDLSHLSPEEAQDYLNAKYKMEPEEPYDDGSFDGLHIEEFLEWAEKLDEKDYERLQRQLEEMQELPEEDFPGEDGEIHPKKLYDILFADWEKPESPIYLNSDLEPEELFISFFWVNARQFLLTLEQAGGFELTRAGNLKRHHVKQLMDEMYLPPGYQEEIRHWNKVINEQDVWLIHGIRVLLELAGLICKKKNAFRITETYAHWTLEEYAGELQRRLFSTYFKKMNLGYMGVGMEMPFVQESIPQLLYRLNKAAGSWSDSLELMEATLDELALHELDNLSNKSYLPQPYLFYRNVLKPLVEFGLLEVKHWADNPDDPHNPPVQFRKSSLYDRFVIFNL